MNDNTEKTETAENRKVYFEVIEYIKELVKKGEVSFGGRIPSERELMSTIGLSRNSIREALRSLENMGLIESRQGQGNFLVNHMGKSLNSVFSMLLFMKESSYSEISQLRRFVEIGAFLLAAKVAEKEEIQGLGTILDQMETCEPGERVRLDKAFHDEIIRISGNNLLKILNEALSDMFEAVISDLALNIAPEDWKYLEQCHKREYQCLEEKNIEGGIQAIREHYNVVDQDLEEYEKKKKNRRRYEKEVFLG